jgi:hypothetical protein
VYIDEKVEIITKGLFANTKDIIVWDARDIQHSAVHVFEEIVFEILKTKTIYFMNESKEATKLILSQTPKTHISKLVDNGNGVIVSDNSSNLERCSLLFESLKYGVGIDYAKMNYIFKNVCPDYQLRSRSKVAIISSNITANRYVDIKSVVSDPSIMNLIVFEMVKLIISSINRKLNNIDAFICASVNGAVLASSISALIRKPVIFLKNVGPTISIMDEKMNDKIHRGRNYCYIFDFMCIGTEFSRVKMLCDTKNAKIVCAVGVARFKKPNTSRPILTLFGINDYVSNYYKCYVK